MISGRPLVEPDEVLLCGTLPQCSNYSPICRRR